MTNTRKNDKRSAIARNGQTTGASKPTSKIAQLEQAMSRKAGARIAMLEQRLGWQKHTVRAAISRMRKAGSIIVTEQDAKTGETVYRIEAIAGSKSDGASKMSASTVADASTANETGDEPVAA